MFVDVGRSLWRENGCSVYNCCWSSPEQSFLGPSPAGLVTMFYCLKFGTPKSKLCYDRRFSRPVRLGIKHWSGDKDQIYIQSDSCRLVDVRRSLWREDGSVVCQTQLSVISLLSVCTISILQVIKCMYIQHLQGLSQFRLSTADHALLLVAPATAAF
jgi:hypothetical protein